MFRPTAHNSFLRHGAHVPDPIDIPQLEYSYASSAESDSPYTPIQPSPPFGQIVYGLIPNQDSYQPEPPLSMTAHWTIPGHSGHHDGGIAHVLPATDLPVHAPIPLPTPSSLLSVDTLHYDYSPPHHGEHTQQTPALSMANFPESAMQPICEPQGHYLNTEDFAVRPPQRTFPTPSELLIDMATAKESEISAEPASSKKPETARKARRRAMARSIGFEPTDPDSISSHDKKRLHLECLEQYVIHLHHQIKLLGLDPEPLECALKPHELSCRSMRILLIHMENITRSLNERIVSEEEKFIVLRDTVWKLDQSMTRNDRNAQGSNSQISSLG